MTYSWSLQPLRKLQTLLIFTDLIYVQVLASFYQTCNPSRNYNHFSTIWVNAEDLWCQVVSLSEWYLEVSTKWMWANTVSRNGCFKYFKKKKTKKNSDVYYLDAQKFKNKNNVYILTFLK